MGHPLEIVGWKVWYADGSSYESKERSWENLPRDGVVWVMVYYANGTSRTMSGTDFYFRARGHRDWIYGFGPEPDPARYQDLVVLKGAWTDDITLACVEAEVFGTTLEKKPCGCE